MDPLTLHDVPPRAACHGAWPHPDGVANIIFDTDIGPDFDDVGALLMVHHYEDVGRARLLAAVCSTSTPYGASCLCALNTYYGRPDVPVGTLKTRDDIYPNNRPGVVYNRLITGQYETAIPDGFCAPDAVKVYRRTLAAQPDGSVTVVIIGMQTNLYDLLRSEPDEISPLSGMELVRTKVKLISCMAGHYPHQACAEFNVEGDIAAAQFVARYCPAPVMYSSFQIGAQIRTGCRTEQAEQDNPLRIGYHPGQQSWDQTSVIYAVEGTGHFWTVDRGDVDIDDQGIMTLTPNERSGARAFLIKVSDEANEEIKNKIELAMVSPKKNNPTGNQIRLVKHDDAALCVQGTWEEISPDGHVKMLASQTVGATLLLRIEASELYIYGGMGPRGGRMEVRLDGQRMGVIDTYREKEIRSCLIYQNQDLPIGLHTLSLTVLKDTSAPGGERYVDVDFFKLCAVGRVL